MGMLDNNMFKVGDLLLAEATTSVLCIVRVSISKGPGSVTDGRITKMNISISRGDKVWKVYE